MAEPTAEIFVRGRCICGRRYRVRHATRNSAVACPSCGRTITISEADLRLADGGDEVILLKSDVALEEPYVVPLEGGGLRLAERGARPGLTFKSRYTNPDAQISAAIGRQSFKGAIKDVNERLAASGGGWRPDDPAIMDFLDALTVGRSPKNLLVVFLSALGCAILLAGIGFAPLLGFARPVLILLGLTAMAGYAAHLMWSTLFHSANGEDELSMTENWNPFDDGVRPLIYLLFISCLCTLPAFAMGWWGPAVSRPVLTFHFLIAAGWFFWPVSVFAVALGDSIRALRPDFLIRCLVAIGPSYVLWWGLVYGMLWLWSGLFQFALGQPMAFAIAPFFVFYCAYALGRVLGLSYRRYQRRLPI